MAAEGAADQWLAGEAGLTRRTVAGVRSGRVQQVRADTEARLLATTGHPPRPTVWVDAAATRAMARWLVVDQGATQKWINHQLGRRLTLARLTRQQRVTRRTEAAVCGLARAVAAGAVHPPHMASVRDLTQRRRRERDRKRRQRDARQAS